MNFKVTPLLLARMRRLTSLDDLAKPDGTGFAHVIWDNRPKYSCTPYSYHYNTGSRTMRSKGFASPQMAAQALLDQIRVWLSKIDDQPHTFDIDPPPAEWTLPIDETIAVDVLDSGWTKASVREVYKDGWFLARICIGEDSENWDDWFNWLEEGTDWKRYVGMTVKVLPPKKRPLLDDTRFRTRCEPESKRQRSETDSDGCEDEMQIYYFWTAEEDRLILEGARRLGKQWKRILETLPTADYRTAKEVSTRWRRLTKPIATAPVCLDSVKGLAPLLEDMESVAEQALAWCAANDIDEVRQIVLAGLEDAMIAACGVKTGCARENILRAKLRALHKKAPDSEAAVYRTAHFSPQEDDLILTLVDAKGLNWREIVKSLPGRSEQSVKSRFKRIQWGRKQQEAGQVGKNNCGVCGLPKMGHSCKLKLPTTEGVGVLPPLPPLVQLPLHVAPAVPAETKEQAMLNLLSTYKIIDCSEQSIDQSIDQRPV